MQHPQPETWALVLKKAPAAAKSRLAGVLSGQQHATLVERLFQHVLSTVLSTPGIDSVAVISPEQPDMPAAVLWIRDEADNMNDCIRQGVEALAARHAKRVLILPSDLPLLSPTALEKMLVAPGDCDMVIAPDEFQKGTNALLLATPSRFNPNFGVDSYEKHKLEASRLGFKVCEVNEPALAFDLDDSRDWQKLCDVNHPAARSLTAPP